MGTAQCDKKTIICDIGTRQYEDEIIKFEKKSKRTINVWKTIITCDVEIA